MWNVQAPDTASLVPRLLYQCYVNSFTTYCSSKNSRSSNAMLQVSLNKRNVTCHNLFGLLQWTGVPPQSEESHPLFVQVYNLSPADLCKMADIVCESVCWSQGFSSTAIDNIFIDTNQLMNYSVSPLCNGLADHVAQLLILHDIHLQLHSHRTYTTRSFNTYSSSSSSSSSSFSRGIQNQIKLRILEKYFWSQWQHRYGYLVQLIP